MNYMLQLDGLRAFAVVLVIISHTTPRLLPVDLGAFGVRLFFVLSGFLITGILLKARADAGEKTGRVIIAFYARRILRIFPVYYVCLALAMLANLPGIWESVAWHATYLTNVKIVMDKGNPVLGAHFWSLAVEEQFYLIWPFIVLLSPRKYLLYILITAVISAPLFRLASNYAFDTVYSRVLMPCCLDTLGMGALLALVMKDYPRHATLSAWCCGVFGGIIAVSLVVLPVPSLMTYLAADTFSGLVSTFLVWAAAVGIPGPGKVLSWKPVVYLGTISYGVYVWHLFVPPYATLFGFTLPGKGVWLFLIVFLVSIVVATASWFLFERSLNRLKKYFRYPSDQSETR